MAEPGDKLERAYRGLAREEPPSALDASILEASRRAVRRPSATRWAMPVSIAAVLMLAVGVTMHMQQEEPGIETSMPRSAPPPAAPSAAPEPAQAPQREEETRAPKMQAPAPQLRRDKLEQQRPLQKKVAPVEKPAADTRTREEPQGAPPTSPAAPTPFPAQQNFAPGAAPPAAGAAAPSSSFDMAPARAKVEPSPAPAAPAAPRAPAAPAAASAAKSLAAPAARPQAAEESAAADPEHELERIAKLRAQGRDAEADRALEQFRKRYPDYRIADAMWERVKPAPGVPFGAGSK
jgi:cytoskeletal protein RodZ